MSTDRRVVVLGAAGNSGSLISRRLHAAGVPLALAGRRPEPLRALADELGVPVAEADSFPGAAAIVNAAGPFTDTADGLVELCLAHGVPYVDIANELPATRYVLGLGERANVAGVPLVTGAGYGPAVTESLLLQLLSRIDEPVRAVRVVTAPAAEAPTPGVQATVMAAMSRGAARYSGGELREAPFGEGGTAITFGGHRWAVLPAPTADLEVAWRTTGAPEVTAYFAAPGDRPVEDAPTSWAYAEIATDTGLFSSTAQLGRGVEATAAIAAETVRRLLESDRGKAGAWTPGAAFGPEFVPAVTGMLVTGNEFEAVRR